MNFPVMSEYWFEYVEFVFGENIYYSNWNWNKWYRKQAGVKEGKIFEVCPKKDVPLIFIDIGWTTKQIESMWKLKPQLSLDVGIKWPRKFW